MVAHSHRAVVVALAPISRRHVPRAEPPSGRLPARAVGAGVKAKSARLGSLLNCPVARPMRTFVHSHPRAHIGSRGVVGVPRAEAPSGGLVLVAQRVDADGPALLAGLHLPHAAPLFLRVHGHPGGTVIPLGAMRVPGAQVPPGGLFPIYTWLLWVGVASGADPVLARSNERLQLPMQERGRRADDRGYETEGERQRTAGRAGVCL